MRRTRTWSRACPAGCTSGWPADQWEEPAIEPGCHTWPGERTWSTCGSRWRATTGLNSQAETIQTVLILDIWLLVFYQLFWKIAFWKKKERIPPAVLIFTRLMLFRVKDSPWLPFSWTRRCVCCSQHHLLYLDQNLWGSWNSVTWNHWMNHWAQKVTVSMGFLFDLLDFDWLGLGDHGSKVRSRS